METIVINFNKTLSDGATVSLNGSPTVSLTKARASKIIKRMANTQPFDTDVCTRPQPYDPL